MAKTATTLKVSTALAMAMEYQAADRLDQAEGLCDAVLAALPDHADALHLRGYLAFRRDALDHAADLIGRAVLADPARGDFHNSLGNVRLGQDDYGSAVACFGRALERDGDDPIALVNLGIALYGAGDTERAVEALRRGLERSPGHAQARAALGLIAFEQGDDDAAKAQLRLAADNPRYAHGASCAFGAELAAMTDAAAIGAPALTGEMPAAGRPGMVVFAACDHGYFRAFARPLALSIDHNATGHDLHLHLFNPEPDFDAELAALKSRLTRTVLTVSREAMPGADPVYFSNLRFVRLHQIMAASGRALLGLDADSLVRGPLDGLDAVDLAITTRFDKAEIGHKMLATTLLLRPSPAGRAFLARVAAYVLSCLRDARLAWYLDQSVLYLVYRMMERAGEAITLAPLPRAYADSDFGPDSPIWAAKGDRKTDLAFVAEAARITGAAPD